MIVNKREQEHVIIGGNNTDFWQAQTEIDQLLTNVRKAFREKGGKVTIRIEIEHEVDE